MLAGWIDRKGFLHVCLDWEHDDLAYFLGYTPMILENLLWIRFSEANKRFDINSTVMGTLTQAQIDACFELSQKYNMHEEFTDLLNSFEP